ncbi:MAG TPA: Lrp/AsnC family transcriptional regulator [Solirubrobacteraceae bacterium]|jgi:DNA-binding Lrp family transcriptional regulator
MPDFDTPAAHNGRIVLNGHDHLIFAELQRDGRLPFTTLGARIGLSEAQVRRRVKWLTEADAFAVTAVAHPSVLGLGCMAWVGLEVRPGDVEVVANTLVNTSGVDYVVISSGRFNVMCEVACEGAAALDPITLEMRRIDGVERTETFVYLALRHQKFQWLPSRQGDQAAALVTGVTESSRQLDPLDIAIVRELERDGRASFREIARELGVSERAVSGRFTQLVDDGALKVIAVGNPLNLGFGAMTWLGITLRSGAEHDEVCAQLAAIQAIDYVVVPSGRYDVMAEVVCRDRAELLEVLTREIGAIDGIARTESFLYLRLLYRSTAGAWGVGRSLARAKEGVT